ncbi:anthranilate phosphoribosyltransferase [Sulfurihydrogenibium azorense Az-Fu1]|uniref:Anthranilate phosphoribosyltransferase n=1 Tax=Sulfurihydrogenibium azorense (strain DSM 15241 / OCM 825 / Az-Fu1) TaxID=204536 RepID=C1DXR6_SULAA|nr:anthranilate phosphoribosyltransferase [Sulfurihydrogenibium azorense]ACN98689.1 anthranilate phosphoribosyltransferase [Sulfurihydrogenibium azorense Az-Fu1]
MIKELIKKITEKKNLSKEEVLFLFQEIMDRKLTDAQLGAVLIGLKMKGETVNEISAAATVMRDKAIKVNVKDKSKLVDTCGTGGDNIGTFNVSTISAFVVAASGAKVAKHGNRSVSSKCGSADLMESLGVKIDMPPEKVERCIDEVGLGFLFAPIFHPAMKNVVRQRREIGVRTIFNILGPLSNPADAPYQLMGVYDKDLVEPIAKVLVNLGIKRAFVVHGLEGLDEVSLTAETLVAQVDGEDIKVYTVKPEDFGLKRVSIEDLKGGDIIENKEIALNILTGKDYSPKTDFVALNSGFALKVAGVVSSIKEGIELAKESIYSKKAYEVLEKLRNLS